jgi:murein DD-endopeptidase MepM/ murein hydrolase activator NlpD
MKIRALLFICCTTILVSAVEAKIKEDEGAPKQIVHIEKMDKRVSELMADRVNIRKNMELKELATLSEIEMEEKENLMFPADELYGSNWENRWVDPFRGAAKVNFPDSFAIDCSSFVYPIAIDSMARITSKYGPRRRRMHKGIDLKVLKGDTIRAAFNGKVRIKAFERRGYGYYVVLRHPNGLETIYGHLSKILVEENQIVRAGETIGLGGNTGRSTGSHLHFETRFLGIAINPIYMFDFPKQDIVADTYTFRKTKGVRSAGSHDTQVADGTIRYHKVKSGDTLSRIAKVRGVSVSTLCKLNRIKPTTTLRIGQVLRCS